MSRAIWKGPFVDEYVLKKAEKAREKAVEMKSLKYMAKKVNNSTSVCRVNIRSL